MRSSTLQLPNNISIPSQDQLLVAYNDLLNELAVKDFSKLARYCNWSRFDPRLAEIITSYFARQWKVIPPAALNLEILKTPWPQAFCVLVEAAYFEQPKKTKKLFSLWKNAACFGIRPIDFQDFFIGVGKLQSQVKEKASEFPLHYFEKWGFYGYEELIPQHKSNTQKPQTILSKKLRKLRLSQFLNNHTRFRLQEYIEFLGQHVTARQAQRDISEHEDIKKIGNTSNAFYIKKTRHLRR